MSPLPSPSLRLLALPLSGAALFAPLLTSPAFAGPVACVTTLEAPAAAEPGAMPGAPVEVTRCDTVQTVPALMRRRYYSYTAPFARATSIPNQITELFGIAMGGGDGTKVMGLGFRDQAMTWDATAIGNTTSYLLDSQSDPMPLRTADVANCFNTSISGDTTSSQGSCFAATSWQEEPAPTLAMPVRGLW
jgi:hypothetical protein